MNNKTILLIKKIIQEELSTLNQKNSVNATQLIPVVNRLYKEFQLEFSDLKKKYQSTNIGNDKNELLDSVEFYKQHLKLLLDLKLKLESNDIFDIVSILRDKFWLYLNDNEHKMLQDIILNKKYD